MGAEKNALCGAGVVIGEEIDEEGVAAVGCKGESGLVLVVAGVGAGTAFDEETADGKIAFDGGEHEESPAVLIGEVGVQAGIECLAEGGFVAAFDEGLGGAIGDGHGGSGGLVTAAGVVECSRLNYSARWWGFLPKSGPK